jgi:hypothetical protein
MPEGSALSGFVALAEAVLLCAVAGPRLEAAGSANGATFVSLARLGASAGARSEVFCVDAGGVTASVVSVTGLGAFAGALRELERLFEKRMMSPLVLTRRWLRQPCQLVFPVFRVGFTA